MKTKDIKALHNKSQTELQKDLEVKQRELKNYYLERKIKQVKNYCLGERLRDDIARIKTVLRLKQISERKQS